LGRGFSERLDRAREEVSAAARLWPSEAGDLPAWMTSPASARVFWRRTRREAELLRVSTLHSLAIGLLRQGGVAPREVLEAEHPALLRVLRHAVREALALPAGHPDQGPARFLLGWAEANWERLSQQHDDHQDAMGILAPRETEPFEAHAETLFQALQRDCAPFFAGQAPCVNLSKNGAPKADPRKFLRLGPPQAATTWDERMRWCDALSDAAYSTSKEGEVRMSSVTYPEAFIGALEPLRELAQVWELWLGSILERALEAFEQAKTARGMATYGDLVRGALRGLEAGRIEAPCPGLLMVDEYQDTSPSQDAFLRALGAAATVIVGDVKQAIYGWRGGDPTLLRKRLHEVGDGAFRLGQNFRSAPAIVDLANAFVDELWPQLDPAAGDLDGRQRATRTGAWPVGILKVPPDEGRDLPALATWIAALSTEAGWTSILGSPDASMPRRRALLLQRRTRLPKLLLALKRRGVQAFVLSQDGFWQSPGIRLLMAALEAVAHPDRGLPCAALLRQLARLTDPEITALAEPHSPESRSNVPGLAGLDLARVPPTRHVEVRWLQSLLSETAQGVAGGILGQGALLDMISTLSVHGDLEPARARRNLAGFLALVMELPSSPAAAFAALEELRAGPERGDIPADPEGSDLIIQTVHASKGLEYEDLILPAMPWKPRPFIRGTAKTDPVTKELAFPWALGPLKGLAFERLAEADRAQQRRDSLNLLYVALTRARQRMALLCAPPETVKAPGEATTWAEWALHLSSVHPALVELTEAPTARPGPRVQNATLAPPPNRTLTLAGPMDPPEPGPSPSERARRRREGELMHAFLQDLLLRWEDASAFQRCLGAPPEVPKAGEMALRFLGQMQERGWRHLPRRTELPLEGAAASGATGRADLVIWAPDRRRPQLIHLVDFKLTEAFSREEWGLYRAQLLRYSRVLALSGARVQAHLAALKSGHWEAVDFEVE
jgi:superfamily I DNA/RNA helicase